MNCPNCKNPIKENVSQCEWCGTNVLQTSAQVLNKQLNKIIRFVYYGERTIFYSQTEVFLNGVLKLKCSSKDSFNFEIENTAPLPVIKFKTPYHNKNIELPNLESNKNYLIEIKYSIWWGSYSINSKLIKEI
jgi:hypothetical protein